MSTINERIAEVVKFSGLSKTTFAEKIGISQPYLSQLCSGSDKARNPSDRTIADICRMCGVNEVWLRTGAGEPYIDRTRAEELAAIFEKVEIGDNEKAKLIRAMARMPDEAFPAFVKFLEDLHKMLEEE